MFFVVEPLFFVGEGAANCPVHLDIFIIKLENGLLVDGICNLIFFYYKELYSAILTDLYHNIVTIQYNILNLLDVIQFLNGNQIINRYAADGRKLETEYFTMKLPLITPIYKDTVYKWSCSSGLVDQTGIIYIDNLEYQISSGMLQSLFLLRMHNTEGYVDNVTINPYGPYYYYYHTDHLGNIREVWRAAYSASGTVTPAGVIQQTQYYPSGLPWLEGTGASTQPYKYNGKEFVEMHGYDTYDIVWRQYYPAIMRFQTIDPFAEKYYSISPYAMCADNTVKNTDPDGRIIPFIVAAFIEAPEIYAFGAAAIASISISVNHYNSLNQQSQRNTFNSESTTQNATASTPAQRKESERTENRAREAGVEQAKGHQKVVDMAPNPQSDGSSGSNQNLKEIIKKVGKVGATGLGIAILAGVVEQLTNPNPSKDAHEAHEEKAKRQLEQQNNRGQQQQQKNQQQQTTKPTWQLY